MIPLNYQKIIFTVVWLIADVVIRFHRVFWWECLYCTVDAYIWRLICNNYEFKGPVKAFVSIVIEGNDCITLYYC